jgi:hypothetical protein
VYGYMALKLVEHVHAGGQFAEVTHAL